MTQRSDQTPRSSVAVHGTASTTERSSDGGHGPEGSVPIAETPTNARPRSPHLSKPQVALAQIAIFSSLLGLWQLAYMQEWVRPLLLKSPAGVWSAGRRMAADGILWSSLFATVHASFLALILATIIGVIIGLWLALSPRLEDAVNPLLDAMNSSPRIAFAPVFIVMFGISTSAKVALAFSIVLFVIISAARAGVHAADEDAHRLLRAMGASKVQLFSKLLLPVAMPSIFAGIRLGLIYSFLGVVASEMISSRVGMGQLVSRYSAAFQLDYVYAAIICLIVVTTVLNSLAGAIERRLLWWQPPK